MCFLSFPLKLSQKGAGGGEGGKEWEFRISRGKLLHIGWIKHKSYCIAQGTIFSVL